MPTRQTNPITSVGTVSPDGLVIGNIPVLDTFTIEIASGEGALTRGAVLCRSSLTGKYSLLGTTPGDGDTLTPGAILCDDLAAGGGVAVAYRSGRFAKSKLGVKGSYTITAADLEALRHVDIIAEATQAVEF